MAIRIPWNEQEEALLLNALIKVLNHEIGRKQAIAEVSSQLRKTAVARGITIDEKFRNENGIALQMRKLEYVLTSGESGLYVDSGWYFTIVQIYRTDYEKYVELLGESMGTTALGEFEKVSFSAWIKKNNLEQYQEILSSIKVLSLLLMKNRTIRSNILQITDVKEIESIINRIRSNKGISIHLGGKKTSYITALSLYRDFLLYLSNENVEDAGDQQEIDEVITVESNDKALNAAITELPEQVVSFIEERNYSYTRPSNLIYSGNHYPVRNWTQVYVQLVKCLFENYPDKILLLKGKSMRGGGRVELTDMVGSVAMIAAQKIAEDLYLETNESANDVIKKCSILMRLCGVNFEKVVITYRSTRKDEKNTEDVNIKTKNQDSEELIEKKLSFYDWLVQVQGMAEGTAHSYDLAINTADSFARQHNVGHGMLRGTVDFVIVSETADALFQMSEFMELYQRQYNRFRAALRKYLQYISNGSVVIKKQTAVVKENNEDIDFTPYREILSEKFPKGFRIESKLDMGRFRVFWRNKYGSEPEEDDNTIRRWIARITVRCRDFVYLPETMASEQTKQRLFAYITYCFKSGKNAVYFDALYKEFQGEFSGKRINNPEMLKAYLAFMSEGRFYIHKNYLTADANIKANPTDEVRDYLVTAGVPVILDDLKDSLSHLNGDDVFWAVAGRNSAEFVRNKKGEYFHADIIGFTQQEIDTIVEMIQSAIDDKGYMGGKELTDAVESRLPSVKERYPFLTWLGLRDVIAYKLRDVFSFRGKIISAYGQNLSMSDIFAQFAANHDYFTLEQLNSLKRDLDTPIYFDSVYANSLRINRDEFVSRNQVLFDIESTDAAINRFCVGDYIALQEVSFFGSFPSARYPWNVFLLEHYVACFSKEFKLLHIGFAAGTPVGAIVKRSSQYEDFDELVGTELAISNISLNRDSALQYLVDIGLLARRNYSGIEKALLRAKMWRSKKG